MLTSRSVKLITFFCFLLVGGLLLGNRILIYLSLLSLCFLAINLWLMPPQDIQLIAAELPSRAGVGEIIKIRYRLLLKSGIGIVTLHQDVPPNFSLQQGSNIRDLWKNL